MEQYYFLFLLGLIWTIAAVTQDMKTREVANWLNFSLIIIALAYRAFYASIFGDFSFFYYGLLGFGLFFALAYGFYYSRAFAGGDAKLLMGYGAILPFESYTGLFEITAFFVFSLFLFGLLWSLIYSVKIVLESKRKFKKEFSRNFVKYKWSFIVSVLFVAFSFFYLSNVLQVFSMIFFLTVPWLLIYVSSLDVCLTAKRKPSDLMGGDWILEDIKVGNYTVKKTVHGLSLEDIKVLKKANKSIIVKDGVPFTPAFLGALFMVFFFFVLLSLSLLELL